MNTRLRFAAAALLMVLVAGRLHIASAEILEQVLVKVNGDIITKTDLEQRQIAALRARLNTDVDSDALKNDEKLKQLLVEVTPKILVDAIDELLLLQQGREKGYKVTDQQFKDWLADIRKNQNLEDDKKFQAALQQEGMTMEELRKNFERQVLIYRVQQDEVGSKLHLTEEEARQYYETHKQEFLEPASVTLREILIEVPATTQQGQAGLNVGQDDQAAAKAAAIRTRIVGGEDFAKVAAETSTAASKANGGLIGPIATKELSPALQQLLDKMKPGDITQPIRTQRGYQIIKLETTTAAAVKPFDTVRDVVAEKVFGERQRGEVSKFLTRLRSQAIIVWKNDELRKAYEQQLKIMSAEGT